MRISVSTSGVIAVAVIVGAAGLFVQAQGRRETARDRVVSIHDSVILDIPKVSPLCDVLEAKKSRVSVGDAELYVEVQGQGTPIVLLHGGPGATHHYFHPAFSRAAQFSQLIYYDQRGCGVSDYEPGPGYSVDQAADDLEKLRTALGITKWIVVGHSYGGFLGQYYATKYPGSLIGLILVGAAVPAPIKLEPTRQYDYLSKEELAKIREIHANKQLSGAQSVFNAHLNGDWKRQNYDKPSIDDLARMARYEWVQDPAFRGPMGSSIDKIDLGGAFDACPIPTLIMEGRWDLTWNTDKPLKLQQLHPGSKLVMFDESAHSPFLDEPERFFAVLKEFVTSTHAPTPQQVGAWKKRLVAWRDAKESSPEYVVRSEGSGHASCQRIVQKYNERWLQQLNDVRLLAKLGMALYDMKRYEPALEVFRRMQLQAEGEPNRPFEVGVALIWQGQMLDLLGRRGEAIAAYEKVAKMDLTGTMTHSQFGLTYQPSAYASQRMLEPFTRVENHERD